MAGKNKIKNEVEVENENEIKNELSSSIVTMEDGSLVSFGNRAKLVSDQEITDTGFTIIFKIISGKILRYTYTGEIALPKILLEMAAFGAAAKAKASTAGCKTHEDILKVIELKIAEYQAGLFVSRASGTPAGLSVYQEAYAVVQGLNPESPEDILKVRDYFGALDKTARGALMADPKVKVEVAKIRFRQAKAELEAMEQAE